MITVELRSIPPAPWPWNKIFFGYFITGGMAAGGGRYVPPKGYEAVGSVPLSEGVQYQFDYAAIMASQPSSTSHLSGSLYDSTETAVDSVPFIPQDNTLYTWHLATGQVEVKGSTPPPGPSPQLAGKVEDITFWQQGMATPGALEGAQLNRSLPVNIYASWKNLGHTNLVGHLELELTLPGDAKQTVPATENQDQEAPSSYGRTVTFGNITLPQEGNHQAKVTLTGWEPLAQKPEKLDEKTVSFTATGAPAPSIPPFTEFLTPLLAMALLGSLAMALPKMMPEME